jgi:hypothetical protein
MFPSNREIGRPQTRLSALGERNNLHSRQELNTNPPIIRVVTCSLNVLTGTHLRIDRRIIDELVNKFSRKILNSGFRKNTLQGFIRTEYFYRKL